MIAGPTGTLPWGGFEDAKALLALAGKFDILFLGTGPEIAHIPKDLRHQLEEAGLGLEVMSSPAASRTYNVLLERRPPDRTCDGPRLTCTLRVRDLAIARGGVPVLSGVSFHISDGDV